MMYKEQYKNMYDSADLFLHLSFHIPSSHTPHQLCYIEVRIVS